MQKTLSASLCNWAIIGLLAASSSLGQTAGESNAPNTGTQKSPELTALEEYNNLIKAQIDVFTNQQKLAGLYFPAVPARPEPNLTREGAPLLKGNAAAYRKLEQIAGLIAEEVAGKQQAQPVTEQTACASLSGKKLKQCLEVARDLLSRYDIRAKGSAINGSTPTAAKPALWLQGHKDVADLMEFQGSRIQIELLNKKIAKALGAAQRQANVASESGAGFSLLATIGPAIQFANGLFDFFRKKTTITSISTETNDVGLVSMVASELRRQGFDRVYYSANFPPRLKTEAGESLTLRMVSEIRDQLDMVDKKIDDLGQRKKEGQEAVGKKIEAVTAAGAKVNNLDAEIKHLEALQKAPQGAAIDTLTKLLESKRRDKIAADVELGKARVANSAAEASVQALDGEIRLWTDLRKSVEKAIAPFSGEQDSAHFVAQLLRVEGQFDRVKDGDQILQIQVQTAGAEVQRSDRAGNVTESSQGGAIVSYLLVNALDGTIQKSRTFIMPPEGK